MIKGIGRISAGMILLVVGYGIGLFVDCIGYLVILSGLYALYNHSPSKTFIRASFLAGLGLVISLIDMFLPKYRNYSTGPVTLLHVLSILVFILVLYYLYEGVLTYVDDPILRRGSERLVSYAINIHFLYALVGCFINFMREGLLVVVLMASNFLALVIMVSLITNLNQIKRYFISV